MGAMDEMDRRLSRRLMRDHPVEAARLLERFEVGEVVRELEDLEPAKAAAVLSRLEPHIASACLAAWPDASRPDLLSALDASQAARMIRPLTAAQRTTFLEQCPRRVARPIMRLLSYPDATAGANGERRVPRGAFAHVTLGGLGGARSPGRGLGRTAPLPFPSPFPRRGPGLAPEPD